jgi:lysozyme
VADLYGVDVASFQGPPGQWRAVAGKISFAAVKITELKPDGTRYVNPDAAADLEWLRSKGHLRVFYLFAHPATSAAETVSFFAQMCRTLKINEGSDAIAIDIETTDGLAPAQVAAWAREVLSGLEANLHRTPLCYSFITFITDGNLAGCERYPLWESAPSWPPGKPPVPRPWKLWAIHQYDTSEPIDRDLAAYRSKAQMAAALGKHAAAKAPSVLPHTHPVIRAAVAVKAAVVKEPVMTAASASTALAAAIAWLAVHLGLHWSGDQKSAALTIVTALAAAYAAAATRPRRVTVIYGALSTAAVALGAFGLHISPQWIAGEMPVAALVVGGILRGHVSPKSALADLEAVVAPIALAPAAAVLAPAVPVTPVT